MLFDREKKRKKIFRHTVPIQFLLLLFIFFQIYLPLWKCLILIPVVYIYIPLQFSTSLLPYLCFNFALLPCFFFFCLFVNILLTRLSFFYIIFFVFCTFCVRVCVGGEFIYLILFT